MCVCSSESVDCRGLLVITRGSETIFGELVLYVQDGERITCYVALLLEICGILSLPYSGFGVMYILNTSCVLGVSVFLIKFIK